MTLQVLTALLLISDRVVSASSATLRLAFLIDSIVSKDSPSGGIQTMSSFVLLILFFFLTQNSRYMDDRRCFRYKFKV